MVQHPQLFTEYCNGVKELIEEEEAGEAITETLISFRGTLKGYEICLADVKLARKYEGGK